MELVANILMRSEDIVVSFKFGNIFIDLLSLDQLNSSLLLLVKINESFSSFEIVINQYREVSKINALNDAILKFNHDFFAIVGELWELYQVFRLHF